MSIRKCWLVGTFLLIALPLIASGMKGREDGCESGYALQKRKAKTRLSDDEQHRYFYYYQEALKQKLLGKHDAAFDLLQHCLEIAPDASEVIYETAVFYQYLGDSDKAEQALVKAAELEPKNIWYKEALASYYINRNEQGKAAEVLEDMLKLSPNRTDVMSQLYSIYVMQLDNEAAIGMLGRIESVDGRDQQTTMEKYRLYVQQGEEEKALNELEELSREYPYDLNYRVLIGDAYMMLKHTDKALEVYQAVQKAEPENMRLQLSLLNYYRESGQDSVYHAYMDSLLYTPAIDNQMRLNLLREFVSYNEQNGADSTQVAAAFERILKLPQENVEMMLLYVGYMQVKKFPDKRIVDVLYQVLEKEPDNEPATLMLLEIYLKGRDFANVVRLCERGKLYYPDRLTYYFYLGFARFQLDQNQLALKAFSEGVTHVRPDSDPGVVSDMYSIMGDLYYDEGKKEQAYVAYDSCLVYKNDNTNCLNNYAYYLSLENEQLDRAEAMSFRTVKLEPENKTFLDTYAWILFMQKRYEEARVYIDKVVGEWGPDGDKAGQIPDDERVSAAVVEHAGDIYALLGQMDEAVYYWQLAEKSGLDSSTLKKKIKHKRYIE